MTDATLPPPPLRPAAPPKGFRPATTEPAIVRGLLIGICIAILGLLLFAPLYAIADEALRRGWAFAVRSLQDRDAQSAIWLTLKVAAISVPLNAAFGIAAAWAITKFDWRGKAWVITLIDLPFSISPVVAGLLFVLMFGANSTLGAWLIANGYPVVFAVPGIVLATMFITFPFVARELIPVMLEQGRAEEEAALTLGASGWRVFFTVTLPNIRWALLYGAVLCTARAVGEFGGVSVVSGNIRGQTNTLPLHVELLFNDLNSVGAFAAASTLTFIALIALVVKAALESRRHGAP